MILPKRSPYIVAENKRPKGGCELIYPNKLPEDKVLAQTSPAKLNLVKRYGENRINKLICGDNLNVLKTLLTGHSLKDQIDLIYIDPPFGTGQDFVGYDNDNYYSDRLVNASYLEFLRQRLIFMRELLSDSGSIYVHIDQKIGHYVKIIMDEVFGEKNFRNDLARVKCNPKNFERKAFGNIKDVIFFYSNAKSNGSDPMYWSDYRIPLTEEEKLRQFPKIKKNGQRYATTPLHAKGETVNGPTGKAWKNMLPPKGRHWRYDPNELTKLDKEGLIEWSSKGNPRKMIYSNENKGKKIQDIWDFKDPGYENSSYPTEKNIEMLKQIILASCKEGGIVLDCFAGSGSTLVAAQTLDRNWIGIDSNPKAIDVARQNLLSLRNDLYTAPSFQFFRSGQTP